MATEVRHLQVRQCGTGLKHLDLIIKAICDSELSPAEGQRFVSVIETGRNPIEAGGHDGTVAEA